MISPVVCTDKLQFDSARFIFLLQLNGAEVVILFAVPLNDPQANVWAF